MATEQSAELIPRLIGTAPAIGALAGVAARVVVGLAFGLALSSW